MLIYPPTHVPLSPMDVAIWLHGVIETHEEDVRKLLNSLSMNTADKIKAKWGKHITVNKSSKRIDFAINTSNKLFLIETNFYGKSGSKLDKTATAYIQDGERWTNDGHQFIWVTDSYGWKKTQRPLKDTFDVTDYIINLDMIQKGVLEELVK